MLKHAYKQIILKQLTKQRISLSYMNHKKKKLTN